MNKEKRELWENRIKYAIKNNDWDSIIEDLMINSIIRGELLKVYDRGVHNFDCHLCSENMEELNATKIKDWLDKDRYEDSFREAANSNFKSFGLTERFKNVRSNAIIDVINYMSKHTQQSVTDLICMIENHFEI